MSIIAELREQHDLTQTEFAKKIGSQQPQVSRWEKGERGIPLRKAVVIASVFNISIRRLLPEVDQGEPGGIDELLETQPEDVRARAYKAVLAVVMKAAG